jgi:hypothetical protein
MKAVDRMRALRAGSRKAPEAMRPLALPRRIRVHTDAAGDPVAVRGRRELRRVEGVRERWQVDDEWWREPISRLYYALVLEGGRAVTLYRDLATGGWYLQ